MVTPRLSIHSDPIAPAVIIIAAVCCLTLTPAAPAAVIVTDFVIGAANDTALYQTQPDRSLGQDEFANLGNDGGSEARFMIQFDLSALPDNVTITDAKIWLRQGGLSASGVDGAFDISAYRILQPWTEGASGNPATSGATWNHVDAAGPTTWGAPGADQVGVDRAGIATSTTDMTDTAFRQGGVAGGTGFFWSWDVTSDVDAFYRGLLDNHGWILIPDVPEIGDLFTTNPTENDNANPDDIVWPRLEISYMIPEPTSALALLAALTLTAFRRGH